VEGLRVGFLAERGGRGGGGGSSENARAV